MVLMLLACQPRVPTTEIAVDLQVVGDGPDQASFRLNLTTVDGQAFTLRDDDQLVIGIDGDFEDVDPQAAWTQEVPVGEFEVVVSLERNWSLSTEMWVDVPAGVELLQPADGDTRFDPHTDNIDLAWAPSGFEQQMSYTVDGDCAFLHKRFFGDAGVARIAPWAWEGNIDDTGCNADLTLRREPEWQAPRDWDTFWNATSDVERRDGVTLRLEP